VVTCGPVYTGSWDDAPVLEGVTTVTAVTRASGTSRICKQTEGSSGVFY
jgi:hypothetical protein